MSELTPPEPTPSESKPTVIGNRYELHRRLAKGGMAMVYLGRDRTLDRPVAVKVLLREFAADPNFVERFQLEAKRAANLGHPNIIGVYDWGQEDGTHYIIMEYVDGQSLAQLLRADGPLESDRLAEIAHETAAGLGFAHKNETIHRDCKTGNILLSLDGSVKIGDFGIATAATSGAAANLTQTGAVMGTATYFSPEQAQGKPLDQRSDLYSLGVVMYEMMTGKPPFKGDNPVAIAMKHVSEAPEPPRSINPDLPMELEAITMKLLAKNPDNRYPSAADLQADLRRFREGGHMLARPAPAPSVPIAPRPDTFAPAPAEQPQPQPQQVQQPGGIRVPAPAPAAPVASGAAAPPQEPPYEYSEEPRRTPWAWIAVAVVLLAVLAGLVVVLLNTLGENNDSGTDGDPEPTATVVANATVPSLTGKSISEAEELILAAGLTVGVIETDDTRVGGDIDPNEVIAQSPVANSEVAEGTAVVLTIAVLPDELAVASVLGETESDARTTLEEQGFEVEVLPKENADVEEGVVFEQVPLPGVPRAPGDLVQISVSVGPGETVIPSLAGLNSDEISSLLGDLDLLVSVVQVNSASVPTGLFVASVPGPGETVTKGTEVAVQVSAGPATVRVPNVIGLTQDEAQTRLQNDGLVVVPDTCLITDPDTQTPGTILEQSPVGGTDALQNDEVTICVGVEPDPTPTPEVPTPTPSDLDGGAGDAGEEDATGDGDGADE